jgi:hypothetical protein
MNPDPSPPTRFPKGQSGNKGGRPKGRSVSARIRELLEGTKLGETKMPNGKQVADIVADIIVREALKADHRFVTTLLDRTEGKATEPIEHSGEVTIRVVYDDVEPPSYANPTPPPPAPDQKLSRG